MSLPAALTPGTVVSQHYVVKDLLNMGGFGAVYRGIDTSEHDRPCAIKETYDVTPAARRQALMEASVLFTIRSPHLPEVYDALEVNGRFYLIMQLIEGQNLLQLLRSRVPGGQVNVALPPGSSGPCQESEVLAWLLPVIDVLQELHSRRPPVMHRDIKPGNIVLRPDNTAVLVDFGLTKLYDPNVETKTLGRAVTEGFSPLEQYVGKTTPQSDIYSMAATMYLLLTNCLPPAATKRAAQDTLMSPRSLIPALSVKMDYILMKALAIHVADRYQSMQEFATALREPAFEGYNDQTIRVQTPVLPQAPLSSADQSPSPAAQPGSAYPGGYAPQSYPPGYMPPYASGQSFPQPSSAGVVLQNPYGSSPQQMSYPGIAQPMDNAPTAATQAPTYPAPVDPAQQPQQPPVPARKQRYRPQYYNRPLPSPSNQGCLWGLLQGLIAAALVLFLRQQVDFYLGTLIGFLFYALAGFMTTRHDGGLFRGGQAGYWTGIFGTITFWLALGIGLAFSFIQHLSQLTSGGGLSANTASSLAWNAVKPDWPPLPMFLPQQPPVINFFALLLAGVLLAWLLGFIGALLGRMRRTNP